MKTIIHIDNINIFELLERHYYDINAKKDVIQYILTNYEDLDSSLWINYQKEYEKSFASYQIAKENFTKYLKTILGIDNFKWEIINFSERLVEVEEK